MSPLITSASVWYAGTNVYVVAPERGGPALVVDAPPDPAAVGELLTKIDCYPAAVMITHGHVDHVGGAGALVAEHHVAAYLHPDDEWLAADPAAQLRMIFGVAEDAEAYAPPDTFETLADGDKLDLAGFSLEVLHTPGHTPGHCCFLIADEGILFSGDQLFAGSVGRTDLPGGNWDDLVGSMRTKVLVLDDDVEVLPGHGPATTIARERALNPFLRDL